MMRKYKTDIVHIFICTNQKIKGKCCAQGNSLEIFDYFKEQLNHKINYLNPQIRFKVVKTSCLGKCGYGPNIVIQPDNIWYNFSSIRDIDDIIEEHLIQGKIITRLVKHPPPNE
jgi:(2Fe-2S) ferredoxin